MRITSYNLNGIRAAMRKGLTDWLRDNDADVVCFQELKAMPEQFDTAEFEALGYNCAWFPAEKKGYSGVALLSKAKPDNVTEGCGHELYDAEGRVLRADFGDLSIISLYLPSGTSGDVRQDVKMKFLEYWTGYLNDLRKTRPKLVICGDYNICREPIDIHDPVRNKKSSGFLPEEREWFVDFLSQGYTDTFRLKYPEAVKYSWWSYRSKAREKNKGWRIDYNIITDNLEGAVADAHIHNDAVHSDHCPISVDLSV